MDEFFKVIFEAAAKEAAKQQNQQKPNIKIAPELALKIAAKNAAMAAKEVFNACLEVGFPEDQALELTKVILSKKG